MTALLPDPLRRIVEAEYPRFSPQEMERRRAAIKGALAEAGCDHLVFCGANRFGSGVQWLTGWPAYDNDVLRLLGLHDDEKIVGFIHVGTPKLEAPERDRPDAGALLSDWSPA